MWRTLKERNGAPRLRVSKAGFVAPSLAGPWWGFPAEDEKDVDETEKAVPEEVPWLERGLALLKRRPGVVEGPSAQSLKRPSMPSEASRFG